MISGIIQITGEHDTGKTSMALGLAPFSGTCFIDADTKGSETVADVVDDLGKYIDVIDHIKATFREKERWPIYQELVAKHIGLKPDGSKWNAIVWDTWDDVYKAARDYAKNNMQMFRDRYAPNSQIRNGEISADARALELRLVQELKQKCNMLILCSHMKPTYVNQVKTEKLEPIQSTNLQRICTARFWLLHNPQSEVPVALVLKRPAIRKVVDDRLQTINFLPRRLQPLSEERSVWDVVARYALNPVDQANLQPHEVPSAHERSILEGTLTPEQVRLLEITGAIHQEEEEQKAALEVVPANSNAARNGSYSQRQIDVLDMLKLADGDPVQALAKLKEKYEDATLPEIFRIKATL